MILKLIVLSGFIFSMSHLAFADENGKDPKGNISIKIRNKIPPTKNSCKSSEFRGWKKEDILNPKISTAQECARTCRAGMPPKICYYHFHLEVYSVLGGACQTCTPNATNMFTSTCQCVLADGVERSILSVNRMLPGPSIQVCEGDKVVIDVENRLEGMDVAIHWHGVFQRGTQYYDGVPFVTQCPILPGNTFRYQWMANNAGTHFWHSHTGLQKMDGIHGSLIIRQTRSRDINSRFYDYDLTTHVVFLTDWIHEHSLDRFPGMLVNNIGQDPESILINGKGKYQNPDTGAFTNTSFEVFTVSPGNRYRFRMINAFSTVCPAIITVEGHKLIIIATDGEPIQPVTVDSIVSTSGERYDFIINAYQSPGEYWIQVRGLGSCSADSIQQLAILNYTCGTNHTLSPQPTYEDGLSPGMILNPLVGFCNETRNDSICVNQLKNARPVNTDVLKPIADVKLILPFGFHIFPPAELFTPNTYNRFFVPPIRNHLGSMINTISYMDPPAPAISQYGDIDPELFCNGNNKPDQCNGSDYCMCTHKVEIPLNAVVEVIIFDQFRALLSHPFHLHGYTFKVIGMGVLPRGNINSVEYVMDLDSRGLLHREFKRPPGKDTVAVPSNGYVILRFKADNPGFWLLHCHFLFHIATGMNMIMHVGTHTDLPPVPRGFPRCNDYKPDISFDNMKWTKDGRA